MRACSLKSCCHTEITSSLSERMRNVDIFPNAWGKAVYSSFLWGVSRSCYLVDVIGVDARVKAHVEVVEHLHHLQRSTGCRDRSEAHDVWEENGHLEQHWSIGTPSGTAKRKKMGFYTFSFQNTPGKWPQTSIQWWPPSPPVLSAFGTAVSNLFNKPDTIFSPITCFISWWIWNRAITGNYDDNSNKGSKRTNSFIMFADLAEVATPHNIISGEFVWLHVESESKERERLSSSVFSVSIC